MAKSNKSTGTKGSQVKTSVNSSKTSRTVKTSKAALKPPPTKK